MMLIDSHVHLYSDQFENDVEEVIQRAIDKGITRFYLPAIDSSYTHKMLYLEELYPKNCFTMMGLHPCSVNEGVEDELKHVKQWIDKKKFVAIGEIGIDLYWDKTFFKQQQYAFKKQIQWAKQKKIPIVIHGRNSFDEIFEILEREKGEDLRGIFHCFSGNLEQAHTAINYNFKLGIGGLVTFKNGGLDKFLNQIDIEHIVLETDAPYLAPSPYRGKRNEPTYLCYIANKVADIYGISISKLAEITSKNAFEIFRI